MSWFPLLVLAFTESLQEKSERRSRGCDIEGAVFRCAPGVTLPVNTFHSHGCLCQTLPRDLTITWHQSAIGITTYHYIPLHITVFFLACGVRHHYTPGHRVPHSTWSLCNHYLYHLMLFHSLFSCQEGPEPCNNISFTVTCAAQLITFIYYVYGQYWMYSSSGNNNFVEGHGETLIWTCL